MTNLQHLETLAEHSDVYRNSQRVAIIDMGSNSFRLIVIEFVPHLSFKLTDEVREVVRLSEGMADTGIMRAAAMEKAVRTVQMYAAFCKASGISDIVAVGTSAIRDAENSRRFLARMQAETGITVRVLSGEEEAYYGYLAAMNSTTLTDGYVVDLGGGSFEITRVRDRHITHSTSLPLGAVRVTEGFLRGDPVTADEITRLRSYLQEQFAALDWFKPEPDMALVGEGGTLRLVGRLAQKQIGYPLDELHGYSVPVEMVIAVVDILTRSSISERKKLDGMKSDRADISLGGALVVSEAMRACRASTMIISSQGVREGLFYERFLTSDVSDAVPLFANVRQSTVLNLAHLYRFQEKHAEHIAYLTLSMFDQLTPLLTSCGLVERELLWAASMLHDIGVAIDYNDHHKHSAYLILSAGLPGYTHREIALIALMARYHRKGRPTPDELAGVLENGDEQRLTQLTALLRLAEQLDRSRDGMVRHVEITVRKRFVQMEVIVRGDGQVAMWAVENHRTFFEQAFGVELEVALMHDSHDDYR